MRITILTLGSRGDVQPYLALGKALAARGHDVQLGAPDNFADWIAAHGLTPVPLGMDMEAMLQTPEVREALNGGWFAMGRVWREHMLPAGRAMLDAGWEAAREADVILHHPKIFGAADMAEASGARLILATPVPMIPTEDFPVLMWTGDYGAWLNRLSYRLLSFSRLVYRSTLDTWRAERLGLGPGPLFLAPATVNDAPAPSLTAISPTLVPRPDDWPACAHMTGFWFLDEGTNWTPDADLAAFLDGGEPPVYIGFGSMTSKDPKALTETVLAGVRRAGVRAVLAGGWGGLTTSDHLSPDLRSRVHFIAGAPHDALFPHMRAVVHHGGAGTVAAGLRAGLPTLVCPLMADQPFWGARVARMGLGPEPIPQKKLTPERLAAALMEIGDTPQMAARARTVGQRIRAEDGIQTAIEIIEETEQTAP